MSSNETAVSREIRETLKKLFPDLRFTRLQCGSVKVKGGFMHLSDPGWPDYIGYTPRGTFFGLEIKDPNGKTSKDRKELQHTRHADIQMCNVSKLPIRQNTALILSLLYFSRMDILPFLRR